MTQAEIQSYMDKCDTAKAKAVAMLDAMQDSRQPSQREIDAAKAAFDALVAEGDDLF